MTINQVLTAATEKFLKNNIPNPNMDAEILLAHVLKYSREYLITHFDKNLNNQKIKLFEKYINRRIAGEPIAYITGHKEFYGLDFFINKNVLVPRPETELMVDEILKEAEPLRFCKNRRGSASLCIIDVGTGSGCIIITLAKLLKNKIRYLATDISSKALYVAKKNAKFHGVNKNIKFLHGNLLKPILNNPKNHIIITANLPYLTLTQIKNSPTIQKEPKLALAAGNDGLKYYRKLFKQINSVNISANLSINLYLEIDPSQKISISKLIKQKFPQAKFQIKKDLRSRDRLVKISI